MRDLVSEFETRTEAGDPASSTTLHRIRLHHPLFSKLSINGFKFIVENSYLFKVKAGQYIYKQGMPVAPNLYFILFGSFVC